MMVFHVVTKMKTRMAKKMATFLSVFRPTSYAITRISAVYFSTGLLSRNGYDIFHNSCPYLFLFFCGWCIMNREPVMAENLWYFLFFFFMIESHKCWFFCASTSICNSFGIVVTQYVLFLTEWLNWILFLTLKLFLKNKVL